MTKTREQMIEERIQMLKDEGILETREYYFGYKDGAKATFEICDKESQAKDELIKRLEKQLAIQEIEHVRAVKEAYERGKAAERCAGPYEQTLEANRWWAERWLKFDDGAKCIDFFTDESLKYAAEMNARAKEILEGK